MCKDERTLKENTIHLCETCTGVYPTCSGTIEELGDGVGNDNVVKCTGYESKPIKDLSLFIGRCFYECRDMKANESTTYVYEEGSEKAYICITFNEDDVYRVEILPLFK